MQSVSDTINSCTSSLDAIKSKLSDTESLLKVAKLQRILDTINTGPIKDPAAAEQTEAATKKLLKAANLLNKVNSSKEFLDMFGDILRVLDSAKLALYGEHVCVFTYDFNTMISLVDLHSEWFERTPTVGFIYSRAPFEEYYVEFLGLDFRLTKTPTEAVKEKLYELVDTGKASVEIAVPQVILSEIRLKTPHPDRICRLLLQHFQSLGLGYLELKLVTLDGLTAECSLAKALEELAKTRVSRVGKLKPSYKPLDVELTTRFKHCFTLMGSYCVCSLTGRTPESGEIDSIVKTFLASLPEGFQGVLHVSQPGLAGYTTYQATKQAEFDLDLDSAA